jgi:hypothetical protein
VQAIDENAKTAPREPVLLYTLPVTTSQLYQILRDNALLLTEPEQRSRLEALADQLVNKIDYQPVREAALNAGHDKLSQREAAEIQIARQLQLMGITSGVVDRSGQRVA